MSLCEVDSDISRLSIDQDICLSELPQGKISAGADDGVHRQGSLLSAVIVGIGIIKHM